MSIGLLTEPDRDEWEGLTRSFHSHWAGRPGRPATEVDDDGYERTWQRLVDGEQIRGICARLDGKMVGIAHYLFHASVWGPEDAIWLNCSSIRTCGGEVLRQQ